MRTILTFTGNLLVAISTAGLVLLGFGLLRGWIQDTAGAGRLIQPTPVTAELTTGSGQGASEPDVVPALPEATRVVTSTPIALGTGDRGQGDSVSGSSSLPPPVASALRPVQSRPITKIIIPHLPLEAEAVPAELVHKDTGVTWDVPAFKVGHAALTAGAGERGNAVLVGHVRSRHEGNIFKDLGKVRPGDQVQVFSGVQQFDYRVVEVREVARTDVSVVKPTETASISLITCTGVWLPGIQDFTERLVVRAELANGEPRSAPAIISTGSQSLPTATATATTAARASATALLRTIIDERFDHRQDHIQGGWPNNPQSTAWLAGGAYHLFARQPGRFVAIGAPIAQPLRDVVVTGTFRKIGGPPGGGYGLIVRDQGPGPRDGINQGGNYYVLEAGDRGEVGVWRRAGSEWLDLLSWTPSEAVRPGGEENELTIEAIGQRLTFFVNGIQVVSLVDSALTEGAVGIFVGGDLNGVVLEAFTVQVLK